MPSAERRSSRVFISHPFSGSPVANVALVRQIAQRLAAAMHLPLAPQLYLPQFIDEATERALALRLCLELVALSDELHVYGEISAGMRLEIAEAHRLGIPVIDGVTGVRLLPKGEPPR